MSRYVHVNVQGCPDDNPYARVMCARVALRKYCFGIYTRVTRTRSSRLVSERTLWRISQSRRLERKRPLHIPMHTGQPVEVESRDAGAKFPGFCLFSGQRTSFATPTHSNLLIYARYYIRNSGMENRAYWKARTDCCCYTIARRYRHNHSVQDLRYSTRRNFDSHPQYSVS